MSRDALAVRDLHVSFPGDDAPVPALRGVDLRIAPGRALGLVGPTGSGKSALGLAVIGLLPARTRVTGSVVVGGTELLGLDDNAMSRHRGRDVAMVFQDPHGSLTPVLRIGAQVDEAVSAHAGTCGTERRGRRLCAQQSFQVGQQLEQGRGIMSQRRQQPLTPGFAPLIGLGQQ